MKSICRAVVAGLVFLVAAQGVAAGDLERRNLLRKGAWSVDLIHNAEKGSLWCSAETQNGEGQMLSLVAYQGDSLVLFIFDRRWRLSDRAVDFILDVDYSRWEMRGTAGNISVSIRLDGEEGALRLLQQLSQGNAVAIYNTDLRRLATFSLSGSSAAILALLSCWEGISPTDPFGPDASDPFGAPSDDPF